MISSVVMRSSLGVRSTPSSGMQYRQRRLHRSVSDILRYVCMRLRHRTRSSARGVLC